MELDKARCHAAATYFLGPHNHTVSFEPAVMQKFLQVLEQTYLNVPYHNWFHAVDVLHSTYRLMKLFRSTKYIGGVTRFALLVSAVGHDMGHPGLSNTFLLESSHELALRYNDKSPLENMHASKLFEVLATPWNNVFAVLSGRDYQDARKVCIQAILNTDNANHFQIIKELQVFYEVNSDVLAEAARMHTMDDDSFPEPNVEELLRSQDGRNLFGKMLLHLADLGNLTKPYKVCEIWSRQCLQELFQQGDKEREMGLPVGHLNDRHAINVPLSQVCISEFLIAPFAVAVVNIVPPYDASVQQLACNVRTWQQAWAKGSKTQPEALAEMQERIAKLEKKLRRL